MLLFGLKSVKSSQLPTTRAPCPPSGRYSSGHLVEQAILCSLTLFQAAVGEAEAARRISSGSSGKRKCSIEMETIHGNHP